MNWAGCLQKIFIYTIYVTKRYILFLLSAGGDVEI